MKISNLILFIAIATLASCSSTSIEDETALFEIEETTEVTISEDEIALLEVINEYRASIGASQLQMDATIYNYAKSHNEFMINQNGISHTNFDMRSTNVKNVTNADDVSENVARYFNSNSGVLNGWLNSPAHKATLEGNFTHTVISITKDANGKKYYTQLFYN